MRNETDSVLRLQAFKAKLLLPEPDTKCCRWLKAKFRVSVKVDPSFLACVLIMSNTHFTFLL